MHSVSRLGSLRVLRLTPHFQRGGQLPVAFDPVGGLQTQTWHLTKELDRLGVHQSVITSFIPGSPRRGLIGGRSELRAVGPPLPEFLAASCLSFCWFLGAIWYVFRERRKFDLVHIHYNHSVWCRALALIIGKTRRPLLVSLNTALWGGLRRALRLEDGALDMTRLIERMALRNADAVIALTATSADAVMRTMDMRQATIRIIPDAVKAEEFLPRADTAARSAFKGRHGVPEGRKIVVYVGRISAEKGWSALPGLTRSLVERGAFLLVCGDGPDRSKLQNAFAREQLSNGWSITGFLAPDDVKIAMQISDLLILPSQCEAFGSVLLEAMASGIPAVAYAVGGIPEVAGDPPAISLVAPKDSDALLEQICIILDDPIISQRLVTRGHQRVKSFSIAESGALTAELYRQVLAAGGPVPVAESQVGT